MFVDVVSTPSLRIRFDFALLEGHDASAREDRLFIASLAHATSYYFPARNDKKRKYRTYASG